MEMEVEVVGFEVDFFATVTDTPSAFNVGDAEEEAVEEVEDGVEAVILPWSFVWSSGRVMKRRPLGPALI